MSCFNGQSAAATPVGLSLVPKLMRIIVAVLLCACACQSAGAQAIHLRYAQAYSSLQTIFALPLLVAERNGYFVREGLDFSMLAVPGGGERLVTALDDGSADLAHVPTPYLIKASWRRRAA